MPFLLQINEDGLLQLFSNWLDIRSLSALDIAITCRPERLIWLACLRAIDSAAIDTFLHYSSSIKWLVGRNITITRIQINPSYPLVDNQFEGLITSSVRMINLRGCKLADGVLTFLAHACPLLQHVDLEQCIACDADIIAFAKKSPRLESISLKFSRGIRAAGLTVLTESCPLLESVDCSGFEDLTNTELVALARGCPSLKRLILGARQLSTRSEFDVLKYRSPRGSFEMSRRENLCEVSDDGVVALVQGCPQMEIIDLTNCSYLTAISIAAIGACCPLLKSISIGANTFLYTGDTVAALAQGCPQLTTVRFNCSPKEGGDFHADVTDEAISVLAQCCPKLHTIDLAGCTQVTDVGIQAIAVSCPLLKVLYAPDARELTGASLVALGAGCPLLEEITYSGQVVFKNADFRFLFSKCPKLRIVECSKHDAKVRLLSEKCPNLQYISLGGDRHCTMIGGGCHRLEVVVIGSGTSDVGIKAIARGSPLLSDIRLRHCNRLTDEGVIVLAQCCPKLHTIDLTGCTRVTNVGIESIAAGCPLLKTIYLSERRFTVECLDALIKSCPQLIYLSLNNPSLVLNRRPKLTLADNKDHSDRYEFQGDYENYDSDDDDYLNGFSGSFDDHDEDGDRYYFYKDDDYSL